MSHSENYLWHETDFFIKRGDKSAHIMWHLSTQSSFVWIDLYLSCLIWWVSGRENNMLKIWNYNECCLGDSAKCLPHLNLLHIDRWMAIDKKLLLRLAEVKPTDHDFQLITSLNAIHLHVNSTPPEPWKLGNWREKD